MIFERNDLLKINKKFGGNLRKDYIEYALSVGKDKNDYKRLAYLWRTILVDHIFTDGNKRTAAYLAVLLAKSKKRKIRPLRLINTIKEIALNNIINISEIERKIRYVME